MIVMTQMGFSKMKQSLRGGSGQNQHKNQQAGRYPILAQSWHTQGSQVSYDDYYNHPNHHLSQSFDPYSRFNWDLGGRQQSQKYQMYHNNSNSYKRGWGKGKRAHEFVELSPQTSSISIPTTPTETSPAPKRQFQFHKQSSQESQKYQQKLPNSPQKKRNSEESPAKIHQNQKEIEWLELLMQTLKLLEQCKPGDEIDILLTYLQPSRATWTKVKDQIHLDMLKLMGPLGVKEILVFGSTLTGLDFSGSDLDYHVQLMVNPKDEDEVKKLILKVAKLTRHFLNHEFRTIYTIQNARVPIIRLIHQKTKITCDINFTSKFGYYNSCFIGHVLSYDNRIKGLGVILKLWSKTYKVAEKMIMSNYCLIMIMIFYLQNLEQPMLDSIKNNQQPRDPLKLDAKYKWNVYFNDLINKSRQNKLTLRELLVGFFEFYQKLNFTNYVVCLYNGELIARKDFESHPDLEASRKIIAENELTNLRIDNPLNFVVQDGFEHNLNIGIKCKKHVDAFVELLKLSYDKCIEFKDEPLSKLIVKLLTDIKIPTKTNESKGDAKAKKKFQMILHSVAGDLKLCQDILSASDKDTIYSAEDQQKFFFNHVIEGSEKFLQEVYLCTLVSTSEDVNSFKKEYRLSLSQDTVNGRKKMNFKDESTMKAEINLSKKMYEKAVRLDLAVFLKISSKDKGKTVDYEMTDIEANKKSAVLNFGNFFSVNISPVLKYYLKKKWEEMTKNVVEI